MGVEVVLGFAVGYLVGTRQGREGLQKALDSVAGHHGVGGDPAAAG